MKPPEEQNRNKADSTSSGNENEKPKNEIDSKHNNGTVSHHRDHEPPTQREEPIKMEESDKSDNDGFDPMESWADDKPVNWNEKIIFSDDDQPEKTPTPPNEDQEPSNGKYRSVRTSDSEDSICLRIPTLKLEILGKSIFEIRNQNLCYIQVLVFDLSYLPVAAVGT